MKPSSHPFHKRSRLGLYYEQVLKPTLEKVIGEPIQKTESETDTMDFYSEHFFLELKVRSDSYHYTQEFIKRDGWIVPTCKIMRAIEETKKGKKVLFFYFWMAGKSLWCYEFNERDLSEMKDKYPEWHRDHQQQTYIPESLWKRIY